MMAWHDESPWKRRQRKAAAAATTIEARLAAIRGRLQAGEVSIDQALTMAYSEGAMDGRKSDPAIVKIGNQHTPEVES